MTKLVKVRFSRDAVYRVHGYMHPDNPAFKAGSVHEMSEDMAQRWQRRGVADVVNGDQPKSKPEVKDDDNASAGAKAASSADGDNGGDKPSADERKPRKGFARNN